METTPESVAYLAASVNKPVVVLPGKSPEPAQAWVGIIISGKAFEVYIYLYCIHSNQGLLYRWDGGAVSKEVATGVQKEALGFTESMGFMMSDLKWREQSQEGRLGLFNSTPMFFQDLSRFKQEVEEEILEIEPADSEQEIVVEPLREEPAETVTEGDFVIHAEAFVEAPGQPEQEIAPEQLKDLEPAAPAAPAAGQAQKAEPSEEDLLLDQLEAGEKGVAPVAVSKPKRPPGFIIEMEEPVAQPQKAEAADEVDFLVEEEGRDGSRAVAAPAVQPGAQPGAAAPEEQEIVLGVKSEPKQGLVLEPLTPDRAPAGAVSREDRELAIRFLIMF